MIDFNYCDGSFDGYEDNCLRDVIGRMAKDLKGLVANLERNHIEVDVKNSTFGKQIK